MKIRLFLLPTFAIMLAALLTLLIPVSAVKAGTSPMNTSADNTTFVEGTFGTFTVTATGSPVPALFHQTGALPGGVTFVDNHDGTATLSRTPNAGSIGTYLLTFAAANGVLPAPTQSFTPTVSRAPSILAQPPNYRSVYAGETVTLSAGAQVRAS